MKAPSRAAPGLAARLWKLAGSMDFAVAMLFIVAVAASIGSVVEQQQPYAATVGDFGELWADVYGLLGIADVYHAPWFLALLAALTFSTGLCVWRNTPLMLREWAGWKAHWSASQVAHLPQSARLELRPGVAAADFGARARRALREAGFRLQVQGDCDVSAKKGLSRRLGYVATHAAIVVLCAGGLVDANVAQKWRVASGRLQPETRDVAPSLAGSRARIGTDGGAFRAALRLAPGEASDLAVVDVGDGFLVRRLPVRVRLDDFHIDYHPGGQPRDFTSAVDLLDPATGRLLRHLTLSVNHPAAFGGVSFFQSGFDDGGTRVQAHVVGAPGDAVGATIGGRAALVVDGRPLTLELREYHPKNVVPDAPGAAGSLARTFVGTAGAAARVDLGRSVVAAVRDGAGQAVSQTSFVDPVRVDGQSFFVSAFESPGRPVTYLRFPLDAAGSLAGYEQLVAQLADPRRRDAIADALTRHVADRASAALVRESLDHSYARFFAGGLGAVGTAGAPLPAAGREAVYSLMSRAALVAWSQAHPGAPVEQGLRFVADSLVACSAWIEAGRPVVVHVDAVTPRDATVLQVTSSPGRGLVYAGMFLLALGVVLLVLPQERRAFVRPLGDGAVVLGLAAHRPLPALAAELGDLVQRLAPVARHVDAPPPDLP